MLCYNPRGFGCTLPPDGSIRNSLFTGNWVGSSGWGWISGNVHETNYGSLEMPDLPTGSEVLIVNYGFVHESFEKRDSIVAIRGVKFESSNQRNFI
jgi:hypothetical protein